MTGFVVKVTCIQNKMVLWLSTLSSSFANEEPNTQTQTALETATGKKNSETLYIAFYCIIINSLYLHIMYFIVSMIR